MRGSWNGTQNGVPSSPAAQGPLPQPQPDPVPRAAAPQAVSGHDAQFLPPDGAGSPDPGTLEWSGDAIGRLSDYYERKVVGQRNMRTSLLIAIIAGGHLLVESVPGLAKTTAAKVMADAVAGKFSRIQCTPDLLPSDIVGTQIYNAATRRFETKFGPVFANFVLLDEVNRSSAKTQSAMLEAMQERQVTIGDTTYRLPDDMFCVIATQNPIEQEGTYPLSEAQTDRFLLKEVLDYPSPREESEILNRIESGVFREEPEPVLTLADVRRLRGIANSIYVAGTIKQYISFVVDATRHTDEVIDESLSRYVRIGCSPRASIGLYEASKVMALLCGRSYVIPEDVREVSHAVMRHRIGMEYSAVVDGVDPTRIVDAVFDRVSAP